MKGCLVLVTVFKDTPPISLTHKWQWFSKKIFQKCSLHRDYQQSGTETVFLFDDFLMIRETKVKRNLSWSPIFPVLSQLFYLKIETTDPWIFINSCRVLGAIYHLKDVAIAHNLAPLLEKCLYIKYPSETHSGKNQCNAIHEYSQFTPSLKWIMGHLFRPFVHRSS